MHISLSIQNQIPHFSEVVDFVCSAGRFRTFTLCVSMIGELGDH